MVQLENIFHDRICYTEKLGVPRILQSSQRNVKLPLPWQKQSNYPVITNMVQRCYDQGYWLIHTVTAAMKDEICC